jgi:hypothetical protein
MILYLFTLIKLKTTIMGKEQRIDRLQKDKSRDKRRGVHIRKTIINLERKTQTKKTK